MGLGLAKSPRVGVVPAFRPVTAPLATPTLMRPWHPQHVPARLCPTMASSLGFWVPSAALLSINPISL